MSHATPIVKRMQVIPVAGYDSVTLTISGAHAPVFTRNLVILEDNAGHVGVGEVHGGEAITEALEGYRPFVEGQPIAAYASIVNRLRTLGQNADHSDGLQGMDLKNLKFVVHAEMAVECALMDLFGQFVGLPLADLLGEGKQRDRVKMLGYLFYVADKAKTGFDYLDESGSKVPWYSLRRREALTPQAIVEQAHAVADLYGFEDFKLKGGVLRGEEEMEAVRALVKAFPNARVNIDPNGAWSLDEAIALCKETGPLMSYVEDPCGPEKGYSGREIMAEFKRATGLRVATNMIATNWRQFTHALVLGAIDIPLADPHFWTLAGSVRAAQTCRDWGMTWGSHSNNHFDISLAVFAHVAAAAPGEITAVDTHWIWQDGQYLTKNPPRIEKGHIQVGNTPGLGLELDMDKVREAHRLYQSLPSKDRDDAVTMRRLIPGWAFDSKKPCMVR